MRRLSASFAIVTGFAVFGVACAAEQDAAPELAIAAPAASADDACAPGKEVDEAVQPNAECTLRTEYYVPDLADDGEDEASAGVALESAAISLLAANVAAASPSCSGKNGPGITTCGAKGNEDCCKVASVPAGKAGKIKIAKAFGLGVYEVTSGRFASFVDAVDGNLRGAAASGKLPGWKKAWTPKLPANRASVDNELGPSCKFRSRIDAYGARTWPSEEIQSTVARFITDDNARASDIRADATPDRLHAKPINCVTYYMAAAFCAWDGGRLPTNEEWAYAALGGSELREYPWGKGRTADKVVTDLKRDANSFTYPSDFPYFDNGFNAYHISPPGKKPAGAARWGHMDMGGNVLEWTANVDARGGIVRGGSWEGHMDKNSQSYPNYALDRSYGSLGLRCAYGPPAQATLAAPAAPPANVGAAPPATARVFRSYNAKTGDHLQGLTKNESAPEYRFEGVSFTVYDAAPTQAHKALYRCRNGQNHFLSNSKGCEGKTSDGLLGYVLTSATTTTKPIYRCVRGEDHLSTLDPAECTKAKFDIEGTQGFAFP